MENIKVSDHIGSDTKEKKKSKYFGDLKDEKFRPVRVNCPYCNVQLDICYSGNCGVDAWTCPDCANEFVFTMGGLSSKLDWIVEANRVSGLHKLPSEQQEAVKRAIAKLEKEKELYIEEPCDCGSHIRHNNGGNYHDWYDLKIDNGVYFIMEGSTCELESPSTWESATKEKVYQLIQDCADWLYWYLCLSGRRRM